MEKEKKIMSETFVYMNEESIDPELICSICQTPFNDPCCTSCDETYCRKCITYWIQTGNRSCPHCRQTLSIDTLRQVPRPLKSMLDQLQVKCMVCEQTELERGNFDDHIQKLCPKMVVACRAVDIQCSWTGQRDQLNQHLAGCQFELIRPIITQLTAKNKELKYRLNQSLIQRTTQHILIKQINEKVNQNKTQIDAQQNENQYLKDGINEQTTHITEQQNKIKQLTEQVDQQRTQLGKYQTEQQQRRDQVIRLRNEIIGKQNMIKQFSNRLRQKLFSY